MNSGANQAKAVILGLIVFINLALAVRSQSFPLYSSSNAPSGGDSEVGKSMVLQPIEMNNDSLSYAIKHLGQQAHVNVIIDPRLQEWWDMTSKGIFGRHLHPEPVLTFRWTNLTAKQAFRRLLLENDLVLTDDPQTSIARVSLANQVVVITSRDTNLFDNDEASIPGSDKTPSPANGKMPTPLIEFDDVPLSIAIENLARQAGINYILDPKIGYGDLDEEGQMKPEPILNCLWENVTAK